MDKLTAFERALAALWPSMALRRFAARQMLGLATRGYDAASARRGRPIPSGRSGNAELLPALARLRDAASDLMMNDPWAKKATRDLVSAHVGTGILPTAATESAWLNARIDSYWRQWTEQADFDERTTIYGLQSLIVGTCVPRGEVLMRRIWDRNLDIPLQIQILEPDYLDQNRNQRLPDGSKIIQGVEFDPKGKRVAYWLYPEHPGDGWPLNQGTWRSVRVPASEVIHIGKSDRPGMVRFAPWLHAVTLTLRDLNEASEAELWRFKVQALLAVFIKQNGGANPGPLGATTRDAEQRIIETLGPGMVHYLKPGQEPQMLTPAGAGGFPEWARHHLMAVAAGAEGLPYHTLTGDLSRANFASYKIGQISFGRMVEQNQEQWLVPQACAPMRRWFIEALYLAGKIPRLDYRTAYTPPPLQEADEYKAALAALTRIRSGLSSLPEEIKRLGYDPRQVLAEIADWNGQLDGLGIVLDSDPRHTSKAGLIQPLEPSASDGGDGNSQEKGTS